MNAPRIQVNGEARPLAAATIAELLAEEGIELPVRGLAVAVNGALLPKAEWPARRLEPGDAVEIVRAMQGG